MNSDSRDDILREITSYTNESDALLEERFGPVDELAKQYLEEEKTNPRLVDKTMMIGKRLIVIIAAAFLLIILASVLTIWYVSKDAFNYADLQSKELNIKNAKWTTQEWNSDLIININQSKVALYWNDNNQISWNCKGEKDIAIENNTINIRHKNCLLFLPQQASTIHSDQGALVIVEPSADITIKAEQSSIAIAENDKAYSYEITGERMNVGEDLISKDDATAVIRVEAFEATIGLYSY